MRFRYPCVYRRSAFASLPHPRREPRRSSSGLRRFAAALNQAQPGDDYARTECHLSATSAAEQGHGQRPHHHQSAAPATVFPPARAHRPPTRRASKIRSGISRRAADGRRREPLQADVPEFRPTRVAPATSSPSAPAIRRRRSLAGAARLHSGSPVRPRRP